MREKSKNCKIERGLELGVLNGTRDGVELVKKAECLIVLQKVLQNSSLAAYIDHSKSAINIFND